MVNILVIEDNFGDVLNIRQMLEESHLKHKIQHVPSLSEGISTLSEQTFDLVLLDLSLQDTLGFNTLQSYLKEAPEPKAPVIVLTGNKNEKQGVQAVKEGAQDYLFKSEINSKQLEKSILFSLHRSKNQEVLKQANSELSLDHSRIQKTFEIAKLAKWELDIVSNLMEWSKEMFEVFGFKPREFQPTLNDYLSNVHVEDRERVYDFFDKAKKTGEQTRIEHRIFVQNRVVKHLLVQARINYDEKSNKILLLGSLQDISYQVENQKNPNPKQNLKDPELPQLAEFFFKRWNFQFRSPLNSVTQLLYLLEQTSLSGPQRELTSEIKVALDDLALFTNGMINYAAYFSENLEVREETIEIKSLNSVLENTARAGLQKETLRFQFTNEIENAKKVQADISKYALAIYNIMDLIVQAGNRNPVQIKTTLQADLGEKCYLLSQIEYAGPRIGLDEAATTLPVKMSLPEMEAMEKDIKSAITLKLIRLLNGTIEFRPISEKKSRIWIQIPVKAILQDRNWLAQPNSAKKILLVEDHIISQIATRKLLTSWSDNVEVKVAGSGESALQSFHNDRFDVVLMDLQLPGIDGLEATRVIRESSKTPIIALTANASKQEEERCLKNGMDDYLSKPFKPEDLFKRILQLTEP